MLDLLNINASGMSAHQLFLETVGNNIANMNSIVGADGKTYKRQETVFSEFQDKLNSKMGVRAEIVESNREDRLVFDETNPYADENGFVHYPDINLSEEMSDMITAQRGYQLNLSTFNTFKDLYKITLEIGK